MFSRVDRTAGTIEQGRGDVQTKLRLRQMQYITVDQGVGEMKLARSFGPAGGGPSETTGQ
jgi:hypothetical protein